MEKTRTGDFEFTPGLIIQELKKENPVRGHEPVLQVEAIPSDYNYKNIFYQKPVKTKWKKPVAIFLLVAGLGFAIWGGYTVYKKTMAKKEKSRALKKEEGQTSATDTAVKINLVVNTLEKQNIPAGTFKFVLETSSAEKAIPRFNKLKTYQWAVLLETNDSVTYKIFMLLPLAASDTTRVIDSLSMLTGKKVYIE